MRIKYSRLLPIFLCGLIVSCTSTSVSRGSNKLQVEDMPSVSYNHRVRFLVMHFTAIDYERSVNALVKGPYVSSHYLIPESNDHSYNKKEIKVHKLVEEQDRAWHAGRSYWQGRKNLNDSSIGIEIVNVPSCSRSVLNEYSDSSEHGSGRLCLFPDYDSKQIQQLIELSKGILERHPDIDPTRVIGHSDIAPARKNDPGPRFPWYELYKHGIGAWYDQETMERYWYLFDYSQPDIGLVQQALNQYGYDIAETGKRDSRTQAVISAFQMHFLPWQVNGLSDAKTAAAIFALLEKYFPAKADKLLDRYFSQLVGEVVEEQPELARGQIDIRFPLANNSPELVAPFFSRKGGGELIIENSNAESVTLLVNGQELKIDSRLEANRNYKYNLFRRTREGVNTLKVADVKPANATLRIRVPYLSVSNRKAEKKTFRELDKLIEQEVEQGFPGAVLMVLKDGKILKHTAYGAARKFADGGELLNQSQPMKKNTGFDMASNTKMFATNLALMKLVSQGLLNVNDPIDKYLPYYRGKGRELRLVKDLLTHTAGYAPEVRFFTKENNIGPAFFSQSAKRTKDLLVEQVPFRQNRGTQPVYSDTDYMLLGLLVEAVSGQALDEYVEQQIYKPLGLKNTLFNPLQKGFSAQQFAATEIQGNSRGGRLEFPNIRKHVLQGEVHDEKAFYSMAGVSGHAGLFSTAEDMAVLSQLMLNRGGYNEVQIFKPEVMDHFVKPLDEDITYGLGWRRSGNQDRRFHFGDLASHQAFGHTGWTGTVTVIDPAYNMAIVLLTNRKHSPVVGEGLNMHFQGDRFETGRYSKIVSMVYQHVLQ